MTPCQSTVGRLTRATRHEERYQPACAEGNYMPYIGRRTPLTTAGLLLSSSLGKGRPPRPSLSLFLSSFESGQPGTNTTTTPVGGRASGWATVVGLVPLQCTYLPARSNTDCRAFDRLVRSGVGGRQATQVSPIHGYEPHAESGATRTLRTAPPVDRSIARRHERTTGGADGIATNVVVQRQPTRSNRNGRRTATRPQGDLRNLGGITRDANNSPRTLRT